MSTASSLDMFLGLGLPVPTASPQTDACAQRAEPPLTSCSSQCDPLTATDWQLNALRLQPWPLVEEPAVAPMGTMDFKPLFGSRSGLPLSPAAASQPLPSASLYGYSSLQPSIFPPSGLPSCGVEPSSLMPTVSTVPTNPVPTITTRCWPEQWQAPLFKSWPNYIPAPLPDSDDASWRIPTPPNAEPFFLHKSSPHQVPSTGLPAYPLINSDGESIPLSPSTAGTRRSQSTTVSPAQQFTSIQSHEMATTKKHVTSPGKCGVEVKKPKPRRIRRRGHFPCSICGRVFGRNYNLTAHGLTHDPEQSRPFECPVDGCDKAFARKYDAQRHYRKLHVKQESLPPEWVDRIVDSRLAGMAG